LSKDKEALAHEHKASADPKESKTEKEKPQAKDAATKSSSFCGYRQLTKASSFNGFDGSNSHP